jgi:hypothetical protein
MPRLPGICLCILGVTARVISNSFEQYYELLAVRPLRDGKVFANFEFRMTGPASTAGSGVRWYHFCVGTTS